MYAFFACFAERVSRVQKISGLLFKISGSDFEIRATNFFFTPMWDKRTENQFSIFRTKNARFRTPFLRRTMSVLRRRQYCTRRARDMPRILHNFVGHNKTLHS